MSNGVNSASRTHGCGEGHGQIDIVNHRPGENLRIGSCLLHPIRRLAQNRRHLTARIRRRNADMRQSSADTNRFTQANGASTTD